MLIKPVGTPFGVIMDLAPSHTPSERAANPSGQPASATLLAPSTISAYQRDLLAFQRSGGSIPASSEQVSKYLLSLPSRLAPMTIYRRAMAIRYAHLSRGFPSPLEEDSVKWMLQKLLQGFNLKKVSTARAPKPRQQEQAKPMTRALLLKALDAMHRNSLDRRDRALMILGFMGALNRARLTAIDVTDVEVTADALIVRVAGRSKAIPATGGELCAAAAVKGWIQHAALDLEQGPLFRRFDRGGNPTKERLDSAYVGVIVKERLAAVGINPTGYSAHSLRRGRLLEMGKGIL